MAKEVDNHLSELLEGVFGAVEATSFEKLCLWSEYNERKLQWEDSPFGILFKVGEVDSRPVYVSLTTAIVAGKKILFYNATSEIVDYNMIEEWLKDVLPESARQITGFVNKTDAMNFHNIFT